MSTKSVTSRSGRRGSENPGGRPKANGETWQGQPACGAWSSNNALWSPLPSSPRSEQFPAAGNTGGSSAIGGFQAGYNYNWQFAPIWVAGIEGDWSCANAGSTFNQPWVVDPGGAAVPGSFTSMSSTLDWVSIWRHYLFAAWRTAAHAVTTSLPILAASSKI